MNVKILTNIDNTLDSDEIEITIKASSNSTELANIINNIQASSNSNNLIIAKKENKIFILPIDDIIMFYSENHKVYCQTLAEQYSVNGKIYELEEHYSNQFIRISKSCIVNISYIDNFDLSYIGNIVIKLKNGEIQNVSKRRMPQIMKFINSLKF